MEWKEGRLIYIKKKKSERQKESDLGNTIRIDHLD